MNDGTLIDKILNFFDMAFKNIEENMFNAFNSAFGTASFNAIVTLVILIWAVDKIKKAEFHLPQDVIQIGFFLVLLAFVNYSLSNPMILNELTEYLDIPADILLSMSKSILQSSSYYYSYTDSSGNFSFGKIIMDIFMSPIIQGSNIIGKVSILDLGVDMIVRGILFCVYFWFSMILALSITIAIILTYLQIIFWKVFAVAMLPLLFFKITRGMVVFWAKTIIALSCIQALTIIVGGFDVLIQGTLIPTLDVGSSEVKNQASYGVVFALIALKMISISFLKEVPPLINGMLGTSAGGSVGAFANTASIMSASAIGAGAGAIGSNVGKSIGGTIKNGIGSLAGKAGDKIQGALGDSTAGKALGAATNAISGTGKTIGNILTGKPLYKGSSNINTSSSTPPKPPKLKDK